MSVCRGDADRINDGIPYNRYAMSCFRKINLTFNVFPYFLYCTWVTNIPCLGGGDEVPGERAGRRLPGQARRGGEGQGTFALGNIMMTLRLRIVPSDCGEFLIHAALKEWKPHANSNRSECGEFLIHATPKLETPVQAFSSRIHL